MIVYIVKMTVLVTHDVGFQSSDEAVFIFFHFSLTSILSSLVEVDVNTLKAPLTISSGWILVLSLSSKPNSLQV